MTNTEETNAQLLNLDRVIGFNGAVEGGLKVHPDRDHLVYPLGCHVIIEDINKDKKQRYLSKHTSNVTCLTISKSGKYIASGQETHMGFKASSFIWNYTTGEPIHELKLHKVKVQALAFSCNEKYVISLGGQDDGSVVVWDLNSGEAICGSQAQVKSAGNTYCVCASNINGDTFITGGDNTLRVWNIDVENRKIRPNEVGLGQLKRKITCIEMADDQEKPYFFCGTSTGDILGVSITGRLQFVVSPKNLFSLGVKSLAFVRIGERCEYITSDGSVLPLLTFELLVGAGDGTLGQYKIKMNMERNKLQTTMVHKSDTKPWKDKSFVNQANSITSIALRGGGHQFFVGSSNSQMYKFSYAEFKCELTKSCHSKKVTDVVFPPFSSELLITSQYEEIRIWNTATGQELKRVVVSNLTCNAICISPDGKLLYSAWDDGKIRAYGFDAKTSDLVCRFVINDAHHKGVTAIACTSDGRGIISGGGEGQVRIWCVSESTDSKGKKMYKTDLIENMKEHKASVSAIKVRDNDKECASASTDGTCIIWDLEQKVRRQIFFANTLFQSVTYGAGGTQIATCGTDRKIGYWEALDGGLIRELEGSKSGAINTIDLSPDSNYYVTAGEDKLLKVWNYNTGEQTHFGVGHSTAISKAKICPNQHSIVSVGTDGAILVWQFPKF